jgi:putative transposase
MRKKKLSESQIMGVLKEADAGVPIDELCRKYGVSKATVYKLKSKFGGMEQSELKRLKQLEEENRRLKQLYANLSLEHQFLKEIVEKK